MPRIDGRKNNALRTVTVTENYVKYPPGSCLIESGDTRVLCTASVEDDVPPFLKGQGQGWVTAEYGMLPGSCSSRVARKSSGRSMEIQRLIGRSLRGVVDRTKLGERTVKIDCDVLQADGGTRTASITGGFIALGLACRNLRKQGAFKEMPIIDYVAAISVGIFENEILLDLNYHEDSRAEMDMNVVMLGDDRFIEVQGTAEGRAFNRAQMDGLLSLAQKGIHELIAIQKSVVTLNA